MDMEKDIVVGKNGTSLAGKVLSKHFVIDTGLGNLKIPIKKIWQIHFRSPGGQPKDEIIMRGNMSAKGTIRTDPVLFHEGASDSDMEIPKDRILSILFWRRIDNDKW